MRPADELRKFLEHELPDFKREWGSDRGFDARRAWQARLHSGNWVAPGWPAEDGGRGLGVADRVACDLVSGELDAPVIAGILGVNNVGPTIAAWGTPEQRAHLSRILAADEIWCQGFSEPDAGSDLAGLRTRAVRDGDEFVINGQKVWTSEGMRATHCQLLVRTDPDVPKHKGISALLVPLDLPGIERRPLRQLTGESDFAELFFSDVRVPVSNLLGPEGEGWKVTMTTLSHERAGVITIATQLEADVERLIAKTNQRTLATPLRGDLRDELIQRYVQARVLAMVGEVSLSNAEAGRPGAEQAVIKLSWSQLSQQLGATKMALAGLGAVCGQEPDAERSFLGSRATTIAGGTTEIMKNILAERVLGLPRERERG